MLNHILSSDTQVILLLCASFGQSRKIEPIPLSLKEYNILANWLRQEDLTPKDLLAASILKQLSQPNNFPLIETLDPKRLLALLERGMMLSLAVEKWTNQGLWIVGRSDSHYPKRLKKTLRYSAPALFYGIGNIELLSEGGLAIVGSREVDEEGLEYTQRIAQTCGEQNLQILSGGARGVDRAAMLKGLEVGGTTVGVLADSLAKSALTKYYRSGLETGRLVLISPYDPEAGFNVGNAMGRNKIIYGLADYALAIASTTGKGGTWAGAIEALERIKSVPVFVRIHNSARGNRELLKRGATPFPNPPWNQPISQLLAAAIANPTPPLQDSDRISATSNSSIPTESFDRDEDTQTRETQLSSQQPANIYEAVLPVILRNLGDTRKDAKSLADSLDVRLGQMQDWLKKAVQEGKVKKNKNPVTYEVNRNDLLSWLN